MNSRLVLVPPERLPGWVQRFGERNGEFRLLVRGDAVVLSAANGCTAEIAAPAGAGPVESRVTAEKAVEDLVQRASIPRTVGLLLVRRGGYGVGVARDGRLLASKTGTRYVQSRTAAGGWSQQRFARRRANQADALVEAAAARANTLFIDHALDCLQPGGDSRLVADCLADPLLASYRLLPRLDLLAVQDPRQDVLRRAAADTRALRILLTGIPAE